MSAEEPGQGGLAAEVVRAAEGYCDGRFSYQIAWRVEPLADGAIIQHVVWEFAVSDCDDGGGAWNEDEIKEALGFPSEVSFEYWEAWTANAAAGRIDPDDEDTVQLVSGFNHTSGSIRVTLEAAFYEGLTLPDDFRPGRGFAGSNPSTFSKPSLPTPTSTSVVRSVVVTWVCKEGDPGDNNCGNTSVQIG